MPTINKREQTRILKSLDEAAMASSNEISDQQNAWALMLIGAVTALHSASPPHWTMNLMAGRADRLREELKEGLKPTTAAPQAMKGRCPSCNGSGLDNGFDCLTCHGKGVL